MNARPSFLPIAAETGFEVEVRVSGTYLPGYPERGPTYDCGGEPAEPESIEDLTVETMGVVRRVYRAGKPEWETIDILAGVDRKSEDWRTIEANIIRAMGDEFSQVLIGEAT